MTSSTVSPTILAAATTLLIAGCVSVGPTQYAPLAITNQEEAVIASKPDYLKDSYRQLFEEGKRNQVLNLMRIGKLAFEQGDLTAAAEAFDTAITQIETIYGNSESAAKARSLWYEEGAKDFKGEPYERAMVYYYRGLIYIINEEFDNARASFLNAIMQDAFAEEQQHRSDFGSQLFLIGWSSRMMGSPELAREAFKELASVDPDFVPPPRDHDTLIIAESGPSPRKLADGVGHHQLVYRRGKKIRDNSVELHNGNKQLPIPTSEDIYWQASSRGGRQIDHIIEGQVNFKSTTAEIGSALSEIGTAGIYLTSPLDGSSGVGAGVSLLGVGMMVVSANAKVRADTRYWDNLPNRLHFTTASSDELKAAKYKFVFLDKEGNETHTSPPDINAIGKKHTFIWNGGSYE